MTLLQLSLMGTTLIVLILLMRKLAGQRLPSGFYLWLWLMAGIRLLLPIRIATPCSIYQLWQSKPQVSGSIDETEMCIRDRNRSWSRCAKVIRLL